MALISEIHEYNSMLCFVLSALFNAILAALVVRRSPAEMEHFRHIILHTAIVDMALAVLMELAQPVLFTCDEGAVAVFLNGPFARLRLVASTSFQFALYESVMLMFFFAMFGQCSQFFSLFSTLIRNKPLSNGRYLCMLFIPFSVVFAICSLFYLIAYPSSEDALIYDERIVDLLADEGNSTAANASLLVAHYVKPQNTLRIHLIFASFSAYFLILAVNAYWGYRMVRCKAIRGQENGTSERDAYVLDMNRQMMRSLFILGTLPMAILAFTLLCAFWVYLLPENQQNGRAALYVMMLSFVSWHWLSVVNPLVTIFTIKPYLRTCVRYSKRCAGYSKRCCLRWLLLRKAQADGGSSTTPVKMLKQAEKGSQKSDENIGDTTKGNGLPQRSAERAQQIRPVRMQLVCKQLLLEQRRRSLMTTPNAVVGVPEWPPAELHPERRTSLHPSHAL